MASDRSLVDGIGYTDLINVKPEPGLLAGYKPRILAQTANTAAGSVANQAAGTVALPALTAGATGSVTISNTLISTTSLIFVQVRRGTTVPAAGAIAAIVASVQAPGAVAGQVVVSLRHAGSADSLGTDFELWYLIVN